MCHIEKRALDYYINIRFDRCLFRVCIANIHFLLVTVTCDHYYHQALVIVDVSFFLDWIDYVSTETNYMY